MKLVMIEYTSDHTAVTGREDEEGLQSTIESGTFRKVDERSAKSLVKKGKARIVTEKTAEKVEKAAVKPARVEGADQPA